MVDCGKTEKVKREERTSIVSEEGGVTPVSLLNASISCSVQNCISSSNEADVGMCAPCCMIQGCGNDVVLNRALQSAQKDRASSSCS